MNNNEQLSQSLANFGRVLDNLNAALQQPLDPKGIIVDASIQRFKYTYYLCWKTLKYFLEKEGKSELNSPKTVFREAYKMNWIHDEEVWLEIIKDRNLTTHTYNESTALEIYQELQIFYPAFKKLYTLLYEQESTYNS